MIEKANNKIPCFTIFQQILEKHLIIVLCLFLPKQRKLNKQKP